MAGNTRQWAKEKLKSACNHLNIAGEYLHEVGEVYEEAHPEVEQVCDVAKSGLLLSIVMIEHLNESL